MARKQFNLEEYLAHPEWKVETRDGCPVRIICTDVKRVYDKCLCGLMSMNKGVECPCIWNANGNWFESGAKSAKDLFFVTPEPELSEDERIRKWIIGIINEVRDDEDWCAQPKKCDEAIAWLEKKTERESR